MCFNRWIFRKSRQQINENDENFDFALNRAVKEGIMPPFEKDASGYLLEGQFYRSYFFLRKSALFRCLWKVGRACLPLRWILDRRRRPNSVRELALTSLLDQAAPLGWTKEELEAFVFTLDKGDRVGYVSKHYIVRLSPRTGPIRVLGMATGPKKRKARSRDGLLLALLGVLFMVPGAIDQNRNVYEWCLFLVGIVAFVEGMWLLKKHRTEQTIASYRRELNKIFLEGVPVEEFP